MRNLLLPLLISFLYTAASAQVTESTQIIDSTQVTDSLSHVIDSAQIQVSAPYIPLRITNLNPYFTLHVDSTLSYQLQINKNPEEYFWYLKNSPVGLRLNKDNGLLTFNANKSYFLSGRLKYDVKYNVTVGVQNLNDPTEKVDTSFTIVFYSTEIVPSRIKPAVSGTIFVDEGETVSFKVLCETGSFPFEHILTVPGVTGSPISNYSSVQICGDEFKWTPGFDFVKETDKDKEKTVNLSFIGTTKFQSKDTAVIRIIVKDALNYPLAVQEYQQVVKNVRTYVLQLKYTFLQMDKRIKRTKSTRTTFDLTAATTSVTGTVLSTSSNENDKRYGKILPSVGLAMVPVKEAAAPNKVAEQNQTAQVRTSIKRLDYVLTDNMLVGERDADITKKTNRLKDELKQAQVQMVDVPVEITHEFTEEELNRYFNSPKVNKKYRMKRK